MVFRGTNLLVNILWHQSHCGFLWHESYCIYSCGVTQGLPWLSQCTLDVLVMLFGIRTCTLNVLLISFGMIGELIIIHELNEY